MHVSFNLPGAYQARHPRERGCTQRRPCVVTRACRPESREIDITRIAFTHGYATFFVPLFSLVHLRIPFSPCGKAYTFFLIILGFGSLVRPAFHTHSLGKSPLVSKDSIRPRYKAIFHPSSVRRSLRFSRSQPFACCFSSRGHPS